MSESNYLVLVDDDGEEYEVDAADCEESEDGTGVYLLAAEGEDHEDFYEYLDEDEDDGDAADEEAE